MRRQPVELTEAEWTVIQAIWGHEPCTAPGVHERLQAQTRWSYSTVRTIMDRMTAKGLLTARKAGKMTLFRSAVTPAEAQRGELLYTLKHAFNGALTPMVQCLLETGNLSAKDLDELESLIAAKKKAAQKVHP